MKEIKTLPPGTELVEVLDNGVILLRDAKPSFNEIGTSGSTSYATFARSEYNPILAGLAGRSVYDKMRKSDGQAAGLLRLVKTPILAARWYVAPTGSRRKDKMVAKEVHDLLFHCHNTSFPQLMSEILLMLDFGFSAFEKVWFVCNKGPKPMIRIKKLGPRHPLDVDHFEYDAHGAPLGLVQNTPTRGQVFIPMEKLLVFTHQREGDDLDGTSALRPAYKHWYFKEQLYKVDAIQKERHGIGVPVIKLPINYSDDDKRYAQELGRNLRTNESAHVVLPAMWDLFMLKLEGQLVMPLESVREHDLAMSRAVLGQFLNSDSATSVTEFMDLFLKSTRFVADGIRDVFNKYLIPEFCEYNFTGNYEIPELRVRRLGDTVDWRTISFALRNFAGAGMIIPDDQLETWIREEMDLPIADTTSQRFIMNLEAPQGMDALGPVEDPEDEEDGEDLPRQSQAGNTRKGPGSNGRVGRDGSGG